MVNVVKIRLTAKPRKRIITAYSRPLLTQDNAFQNSMCQIHNRRQKLRSKGGTPPGITRHLGGYIRVTAATIDEAKSLLAGNPHFEAGRTVEIRELPQT
jgi:hypothetical protein